MGDTGPGVAWALGSCWALPLAAAQTLSRLRVPGPQDLPSCSFIQGIYQLHRSRLRTGGWGGTLAPATFSKVKALDVQLHLHGELKNLDKI